MIRINILGKLSLFLFILSLFLTSTTTIVKAQSEPLKVRVAVYENPPKVYTDVDGKLKGFWPEIVDYLAEKMNWEVEYIHGTFNEGLERLLDNEVDTLVDVGYSVERSRLYDFNKETAFINWAGVYSSEDLNINSISDFAGKRIAVLKGDIHFLGPLGIQALLDSFGIKATFVALDSYADNLQAVSDGTADIAIVNRLFGAFQEDNYNVKRTSVVFNPIELRFAFSKNGVNTARLISEIDSNLVELKGDPDSIYYDAIIRNLENVVRTVEVEGQPSLESTAFHVVLTILVLISIVLVISRRYKITFVKRT